MFMKKYIFILFGFIIIAQACKNNSNNDTFDSKILKFGRQKFNELSQFKTTNNNYVLKYKLMDLKPLISCPIYKLYPGSITPYNLFVKYKNYNFFPINDLKNKNIKLEMLNDCINYDGFNKDTYLIFINFYLELLGGQRLHKLLSKTEDIPGINERNRKLKYYKVAQPEYEQSSDSKKNTFYIWENQHEVLRKITLCIYKIHIIEKIIEINKKKAISQISPD